MKSNLGITSLFLALSSVIVAGSLSVSAEAAVTVSPARAAVVTTTQRQQFNASMGGATWSVDNIVGGNSTVGTIDSSGL